MIYLATGGTIEAVAKLVEQVGGEVVAFRFCNRINRVKRKR